ncbi:MAG: RlmE family RNA methyltransferase [Burkholderiaceae bacterium]|nr:MAG: RlmE family RNA methyltransferase [Burkholderiaceae bacterium]
MAKNKFNKAWVMAHVNDPYVKLAQQQGYRARAAFKLKEIDEQEKLIKPGMTIVDLGSTPGSWSQVAREKLVSRGKINGHIVALDLLEMEPIEGVHFILGDFREDAVLEQLEQTLQTLGVEKVDLVLSDMAPNLSGVESADMARIAHVCEIALEFSRQWLKPEGALLVKTFHGSGFSQIVESFKQVFVQVVVRKPKASRDKSAETYLLGKRLKVVK